MPMNLKEMSRQDCLAFVAASNLGRLACIANGRPYVVPISYAFEERHLYSFSLEGTKVDWMRANPAVCVLVDQVSTKLSWKTVVVDGQFEELTDTARWREKRDHAWSLLQSRNSLWWLPGSQKPDLNNVVRSSRHLFYRVNIGNLTGRQSFPDE
jgi:nitroimidazol reductase NimA-like FMN-containing flavoprotein (pyridoxamine 5'-phosphate oxidase superfamily)